MVMVLVSTLMVVMIREEQGENEIGTKQQWLSTQAVLKLWVHR